MFEDNNFWNTSGHGLLGDFKIIEPNNNFNFYYGVCECISYPKGEEDKKQGRFLMNLGREELSVHYKDGVLIINGIKKLKGASSSGTISKMVERGIRNLIFNFPGERNFPVLVQLDN